MTSSRISSDQSGSAAEPSDSQWAAVLLDGWLWAEAALKPEKSEMGVKLEVFRVSEQWSGCRPGRGVFLVEEEALKRGTSERGHSGAKALEI